jgi:exodeoxyribonuclease V alpha subunit
MPGDTIDDLQIVTGRNDGSPVARKPLNKMLQKLFNADGYRLDGNPFRVGDKVVCLKNGTYPDAEEQTEEHFVANGELGRVLKIMPGRMLIRLADPVRCIAVIHAPVQENESEIADSEDAQRGAVGDWDLGYALSVHRSQGSQWKYVIVMADSGGAKVQTRNWLYTAISRAETATWVIGLRQVVNAMLRRDGISGRKTFLRERILGQRAAQTIDYRDLFAEV